MNYDFFFILVVGGGVGGGEIDVYYVHGVSTETKWNRIGNASL